MERTSDEGYLGWRSLQALIYIVIVYVNAISGELPGRCSAQLLAHHDGGGAASVRAAIIAGAFPDLGEPKTFIESER